ncbi:MAG: hypothetical protein WA240_07520 [Nitrospirota bacterium]
MAYKSLVLDTSTPQKVRELIVHIEALSFSDVHSMLRLPVMNYHIAAGCNFAITHVLMSIIGGISTTLYKQQGQVGDRFIGLLKDYYPWDLEPKGILPAADAADAIYNVFRNPLTHDLGLDLKQKSKGIVVKIKRLKTTSGGGRDRGLTEKQIEHLEVSQSRPTMSATVAATSQKKILLVEGLYWGTRRMIERLSADNKRMIVAENFLVQL